MGKGGGFWGNKCCFCCSFTSLHICKCLVPFRDLMHVSISFGVSGLFCFVIFFLSWEIFFYCICQITKSIYIADIPEPKNLSLGRRRTKASLKSYAQTRLL